MREKVYCPYCGKGKTEPQIKESMEDRSKFLTAIPILGLGFLGASLLKSGRNSVDYTVVYYDCKECGKQFPSEDTSKAELLSAKNAFKNSVLGLLLWGLLVVTLFMDGTVYDVVGLFLGGASSVLIWLPQYIALKLPAYALLSYVFLALLLAAVGAICVFAIVKAVKKIQKASSDLRSFQTAQSGHDDWDR